MSDDQPATHAEDIDVDEGGAESVVGGASRFKNPGADIHHSSMTMSQAIGAGYQQVGSAANGDALMRNAKNGKEIVCR